MPAKIVIVDDHSIVREGLKQLLELDGDVEVIGEASDGIECLSLLEKTVPQVLLLDINMPKMNGLEVLEKLKENNVNVKVVILTVHNEIEFLLKAVEIGIDGYLLKEGLKLLQYDYLGGSGSRGYGKILFHDIKANAVVGTVPEEILTQCNNILAKSIKY